MTDCIEEFISAREIKGRISELAERINSDYAGKSVLLVGVLKGAFVFTADLMRELKIPVRVDFMALSSYGSGSVSSGEVKILKDITCPVEGRDIIIVEDILDSGVTLSYIMNLMGTRNPASVKICVLLDKPSRRRAGIEADYAGFEIEDKFVVGYGLDYDEKYRNLPYVGVLNPGE